MQQTYATLVEYVKPGQLSRSSHILIVDCNDVYELHYFKIFNDIGAYIGCYCIQIYIQAWYSCHERQQFKERYRVQKEMDEDGCELSALVRYLPCRRIPQKRSLSVLTITFLTARRWFGILCMYIKMKNQSSRSSSYALR